MAFVHFSLSGPSTASRKLSGALYSLYSISSIYLVGFLSVERSRSYRSIVAGGFSTLC